MKHAAFIVGATLATVAPTSAYALKMQVDWAGTTPCNTASSPVFTFTNIPKEARKLRFRLDAIDGKSNLKADWVEIAYSGQVTLEKGTFVYKPVGPCPAARDARKLLWTVEALNDKGEAVAFDGRMAPYQAP